MHHEKRWLCIGFEATIMEPKGELSITITLGQSFESHILLDANEASMISLPAGSY